MSNTIIPFKEEASITPLFPHQKPESYHKWLATIADLLSRAIETEGAVTPSGFSLSVLDSVPQDKYHMLVSALCGQSQKQKFQAAVIRWNVGWMLNDLARKTGKPIEDVIGDDVLCRASGLTYKTLSDWARIARNTPPNLLVPGCSWAVIQAWGEVRRPTEPWLLAEFHAKREESFKRYSADPAGATCKNARKEAKDAANIGKPEADKHLSPKDRLLVWGTLLRKLRYVNEMGDAHVADVGFQTRGDLVNAIEAAETDLVNLRIIPQNATLDVPLSDHE